LKKPSGIPNASFYILTNSRAHEPDRVHQIVAEAVRSVLSVNRKLDYQLLFINRSDATLRNHFTLEVYTIHETLILETRQSFKASPP
jgi:hypothetical protein